MSQNTSITIRLTPSLKEKFESAVKRDFKEAVLRGEEYTHISCSEVIRAFIRAYTRGDIQ